jgi:hypothetical protein
LSSEEEYGKERVADTDLLYGEMKMLERIECGRTMSERLSIMESYISAVMLHLENSQQ